MHKELEQVSVKQIRFTGWKGPQTDPEKEHETVCMEYVRFGYGKEPFVILPGLSLQSVLLWKDKIAEAYQPFTKDFTVYVFDRRRDLPATYPVREMAKDTAAAIRAVGLDRVRLFGASQGGMIAMEIAVLYPELVKKLILGSTTACVGEPAKRVIGEWIRLAKEQNAEALSLAFGKAIYPPELFEASRASLLEAAKAVTADDLKRFAILAEGTLTFDVTRELNRIACPVLAIADRDDRIFGVESIEQLERALSPEIRLESHLYSGYGHAAYDLAPDYKDRMLRFLSEEAEKAIFEEGESHEASPDHGYEDHALPGSDGSIRKPH